MAKLTDTQLVVLSAASQRPRSLVLPLPERIRGGAAKKVVAGLLAKKLVQEVAAEHDDPIHREAEAAAHSGPDRRSPSWEPGA